MPISVTLCCQSIYCLNHVNILIENYYKSHSSDKLQKKHFHIIHFAFLIKANPIKFTLKLTGGVRSVLR